MSRLVSHCCCPDAVLHNSTKLCTVVSSQGNAAQFDAFKSNVDFIHTYNAAHPSHQVGLEAAVWQVSYRACVLEAATPIETGGMR